MRVLIVTHYFRPHRGGVETVAFEQARRLAARGHDVMLITSRLPGDAAEVQEEGFHVRRIPVWNALERKGIPYPIFHPSLVAAVRKEAAHRDVVLAHSHTFLPSVVAALLSRLGGTPLVVLQHNTRIEYRPPWNVVQAGADFLLGKLTLSSARRCLAVSSETRSYVRDIVPGHAVDVLMNGVDLARFSPARDDDDRRRARRAVGIPEDRTVVLSIRRLQMKNGLGDLVDAAALLRERRDVQFCIGGGGPDRESLTRYIAERKLDNVQLLGFVPDERLADAYRAADLFVLPSRSGEGLPMAILEAFASGLPVVATRAGGQIDLVDDQTGWLVAPSSPTELAAACRAAIDDRAERIRRGERALARAQELDWERQIDVLCHHLREVAA